MEPVRKEEQTSSRKKDHVDLVVEADVLHRDRRTGLADLHMIHNALPELAYDEIDIRTQLFAKPMLAPLVISSMTGGYPEAERINGALARAAEHFGLAMGIGSTRQAIENGAFHSTFSIVRTEAPNACIFSNIGAAEVAKLNREGRIRDLRTIIDLIEADALAIHLNPLQELMQPEGTPDFRGVLAGIEACVSDLEIPIIVKEVGAGISREVATRLLNAGVHAIDVAGAGGTSWAGVEILRREERDRTSYDPFWDWGMTTVESLRDLSELRPTRRFTLIASGGITNGIEIAKCLALGADLAGIARPLIKCLMEEGESGLHRLIEGILFQLKGAMFLTGAANIADLCDGTRLRA